MKRRELLAIYLSDHPAGSAGGEADRDPLGREQREPVGQLQVRAAHLL